MNLAAYAVSLLYMLFLFTASPRAEITNNNFKITRSPLSDLLSQQTVRQSFQDSSGLLWFLTQEGLHRYDGYEVRRYQANEESIGSIGHNNVQNILQDHSGKIWISTIGAGLTQYEPESSSFRIFSTSSKQSELLTNNVSSMLEDSFGYIWIGYIEGGISIFDPFEGTVRHLLTFNGEANINGVITDFATDDAEHMWIGTSKGGLVIYNRKTGEFTRFRSERNNIASLGSDNITALEIDEKARLWIGTESSGLVLMDMTSKLMKRMEYQPNQSSSLSDNSINMIYRDKADRIWVGTDGGLNLYKDENRFIRFTETSSNLANNVVLSMLQDQQGNFWIGTHYGLFTGFQSHFDIFDSKRGLPAESITSFAETSGGDLWVGSFNGLYKYQEAKQEFIKPSKLFNQYIESENRIMSMAGSNSMLWVGKKSRGLDVIDTQAGTVRTYTVESDRKHRLNNNAVTNIAVTSDGTTWVGTFGGGINKIHTDVPEGVKYYTTAEIDTSISSDYVMRIVETSQNNIYIATTVGLNRYEAEITSVMPLYEETSNSLPPKLFILDVHEDKLGNLWLGTQYDGLKIWKAREVAKNEIIFLKIKTTPPLPSSTIYAIEEDSSGFLWLSTTNGLVRLDPATQKIITFDYSDGLQDNEFNFGASFKDSQGRLYFGGNKGYNRFRPEDVIRASAPPPMVMTNVRIAGVPIGFDVAYQKLSTLHLDHNDQFVNLEFSALDYTDPQKNRYQYRLQNFDRQWIDLGARNNISLTNLPSGVYQLQIKGANSEDIWNHDGLKLTLMVYPPPWLSWWAFSCYGAIALWLLWFFRRYYDNYLLRERATENAASMHVTADRAMDDLQDQLEMEQVLVRNVHDHSENTLKIIADLLSKQAEAIGDESILDLFSDNQERFNCLQHVEKNLYYVAGRLEVNFHGFVEDLITVHFKGQPLANVDIAVVNDANEIGIPAAIAVPAAMITNELFCNSIKHAFSSARGVHYIRIAMEENIQLSGWTLEISDSGSGLPASIDPNQPSTLGMEIVQQFTQAIKAELKVSRQQGTHFTVAIPKPLPAS